MHFKRTGLRNRKIFAAHKDGESIEKLAKRYRLSGETIQQIIAFERHLLAVSVDAYYKELRAQGCSLS